MLKGVRSSLLVDVVLCVTLFLLIIFSAPLVAQSTNTQSKAAQQPKAAAPKVTPEQERGLRLLEAAEAESVELQPDMRAFIALYPRDYRVPRSDHCPKDLPLLASP